MSQGHNRTKIVDSSTKYVCTSNELDKLLLDGGDVKSVFQNRFNATDAWRMHYDDTKTVSDILNEWGISYEHPTVRDAVALDIVKLDDSSVSNDYIYTYNRHKGYSRYEYERYLLHKNFRPQLANLALDWSKVLYKGRAEPQQKRTQDVMYQGVKLSNVILRFFNHIFLNGFNQNTGARKSFNVNGASIPFTNSNDFTTEVSLIPNTHVDFRPITSRAYYDEKYIGYLKQLKKYNINAISTFALVDPAKDKNHTGEYLVKVQRKFGEDNYGYIVARMDKDGQFIHRKDNGNLDLVYFHGTHNTILCVCKQDFCQFDTKGYLKAIDREVPEIDLEHLKNEDVWHHEERGRIYYSDSPTRVTYTDESGLEPWTGNISGTLDQNSIPNRTHIKTIVIGNTIERIGDSAFHGCNELTSVTTSNTLISIERYAFWECSKLSNLLLSMGLKRIGTGAFQSCTELASVAIPIGVTIIDTGAFEKCVNLRNVTIPSTVVTLGKWAFSKCSRLTNVVIPNSVTSIGARVFSECESLTNVKIPNKVKSIGSRTFYNCSGLTSVIVGTGVTYIDQEAFSGCSGLTSLLFPGRTLLDVKNIKGSAGNKYYPWGILDESIIDFTEPVPPEEIVRPYSYDESYEWGYRWIKDIPMVKSTTSSHYSIFRQRIPNYDLKQVRHYLQFKNRLEGMELALEQLNRNVRQKEVQISDCFTNETLAIQRMFQEFTKNKPLMELVMRYYELIAEYDELMTRWAQLRGIKDEKQEILRALIAEYNELLNREMDKKLALGQKIGSVKLELNKSIVTSIEEIERRINEIRDVDVPAINGKITAIITSNPNALTPEQKEALSDFQSSFDDKKTAFVYRLNQKTFQDYHVEHEDVTSDVDGRKDRIDKMEEALDDPTSGSMWVGYNDHLLDQRDGYVPRDDEYPIGSLADIKTGRLTNLIRKTEKWRNYMYNLGYELNQLKKIQTLCSDATIKVRRLVHNFAQKMADTEEQIWDSSHTLRPDFSFTAIASASLREIILLHDWYAANAGNKTYKEMGFASDEEFLAFRRKCNKVAFNLRKNQYKQSLLVQKDKLQKLIQELKDKIGNRGRLHYQDKYGWDAKEQEEKEWSVKDTTPEAIQHMKDIVDAWKAVKESARSVPKEPSVRSVNVQERKSKFWKFVDAYAKLKEEQKEEMRKNLDERKMKGRVLGYLKYLGLIQKESDIEKIATRKQAVNFEGDIQYEMWKLQQAKKNLEEATTTMTTQRQTLQTLIDGVTKAEGKIAELTNANKRIFNACIGERNRNIRNKLLMDKLDNEDNIMKLKMTIKKIKKENLEDFSSLEKMRHNVDIRQAEYDKAISTFKETIGVNQDTINQLIVEIYNKYQDDILGREKSLELREEYS